MAEKIHYAVGINSQNYYEDVFTIQMLLNRVPAALGGPAIKLVVDGWVGKNTVAAIVGFQSHHFNWSDGRVDPHGATLDKLNTCAVLPPSVPPPQPPKPPASPSPPDVPPNSPSDTPPNSPPAAPKPPPGYPAHWVPGAPSTAIISKAQGDITVKFPGGSRVQALAGMYLPNNSSVHCRSGSGEITFVGDGSKVYLTTNTLVIIYGHEWVPPKNSGPPVKIDSEMLQRGLDALRGKL